jgi:hypothetical protein
MPILIYLSISPHTLVLESLSFLDFVMGRRSPASFEVQKWNRKFLVNYLLWVFGVERDLQIETDNPAFGSS